MEKATIFEAMEPVHRKPVSERVAMKLIELIRTGNLKAGDLLPTENELAAALQVSRPVVREALRGLAILGIVESRQGGRSYVTDLSPSRLIAPIQMVIAIDETNVDALYEARAAVEPELLQLGARRATPTQILRLRDMVSAGYRLVNDPVGFRVLDLEFHSTLIALAGNPFLERIALSLYDLGMEYRRVASETDGVIARSAIEHEEIVKAIAAGDSACAAAAMRAHLQSIAHTTRSAMLQLRKKNKLSVVPLKE
jgi:GntR family transcriptional regulator, transcriptional repressor for pyruvate dehydrogenase complex